MIQFNEHDDTMLTVRDLAERYKLSVPGIRQLIRKGELPRPFKIGASLRWHLDDIRTFEHDRRNNR